MRGEQAGHTLQTTALVNEAYIRLVDSSRVRWQNRAHFFAIAAQLMRRILVDFARRQQFQKRGGDWRQVTLAEGWSSRQTSDRRSRGCGRGASRAGQARSSQSASRGAAVLRRTEPGGDGGSARGVNRYGGAGLESGQGVADA